MGGGNKALLPLAGKPLLRHVIDRLRPQLGEMYLSVEQASEAMAKFGLPQIADPRPDAGPLAGLLTALKESAPGHEWLLLAPCDAPFIPLTLAERLLQRARSSGLPGAVVRYASEIQPTFSIWNRNLLPRLEEAVVSEKLAGFKQFLQVSELAILDWPGTNPSPFFNINDQDALRQASRLIESDPGEPNPCAA
jgi:molybdopterin-guanine dinucleotide biosynthesis protein A